MPDPERNIADIESLRDRYRYDPETGYLYRRSTGRRLGGKTGRNREYLCVWFDNKRLQVHRVAWAMTYGYWPNCIDHINRNGHDNRLVNLRDVDVQTNCRNTGPQVNNKTGHLGVYPCIRTNRYKATITVDGKQKWLGRFSSIDDAIAARRQAEIEYGWPSKHLG